MHILPISTIYINNNSGNKSYPKISTAYTEETAFKAGKGLKIRKHQKHLLPAVTLATLVHRNKQKNTKPQKNEEEKGIYHFNTQIPEVPQDDVPTRNKFSSIIAGYGSTGDNYKQGWLDCYDKSPEYAFKFWNMKNSDGVSLLDSGAYNSLGNHSNSHVPTFPIDNVKNLNVDDIEKYYFALQKLVDLKDDNNSPIISYMDTAVDIINELSTYNNHFFNKQKFDSIIKILTLKDSNGNFRFRFDINNEDITPGIVEFAEFFCKYPQTATKYALKTDKNGEFRYNIDDLIEIGGKYGCNYECF